MSKFSVPLEELAAKMKQSTEMVARKAILDLFRSVILASPVETGQFRANWNVSVAVPNETVTVHTHLSRALRQADKVMKLPMGQVFYLTNGLPYARRLEYGWSEKAPGGMVRIAAMRFQEFVDKASRA